MAKKEKMEDNQVLVAYIKKLKWKLFWMSGKKKKLLIDETRAHLIDLATDIGGKDTDKAFRKAIERFGAPKQIARNYKYQYGFGKKFILIMMVITMILATFTIPFFSNFPPIGEDEEAKEKVQTAAWCCGVTSVIFTILTFAVIIFTGIKGGRWHGLAAGIAAFVARTVFMMAFGVFYGVISTFISNKIPGVDINFNFDPLQVCGMFFISLLMIVAGVVAGRGIKAFKKEGLFEDGAETDDDELDSF